MLKFKLEGADKMQKEIEKLSKRLDADNVEPVLFEGAQIITRQVQNNVNSIRKVTGNLRRSPVTKKMDRRGDEPAPSIAAIDRRIAPHAWLVEHKHNKPFFRPAWDSKRKTALQHIKNGISKLIKGR